MVRRYLREPPSTSPSRQAPTSFTVRRPRNYTGSSETSGGKSSRVTPYHASGVSRLPLRARATRASRRNSDSSRPARLTAVEEAHGVKSPLVPNSLQKMQWAHAQSSLAVSFTVRRLPKLHWVLRSVPTRSANKPTVSSMGTTHDEVPGSRFGASVRVYATVTLVHPIRRPQRTGF